MVTKRTYELLYFLYEGGLDFISCSRGLDISLQNKFTREKARENITIFLERYGTNDQRGKIHPIYLLEPRLIKELIESLQQEALTGTKPYSNNGPAVW
jgi:hypothetical protein